MRLTRHILLKAPDLFPMALTRALVAIAKDGARERDRLLRTSQAILGELGKYIDKIF